LWLAALPGAAALLALLERDELDKRYQSHPAADYYEAFDRVATSGSCGPSSVTTRLHEAGKDDSIGAAYDSIAGSEGRLDWGKWALWYVRSARRVLGEHVFVAWTRRGLDEAYPPATKTD